MYEVFHEKKENISVKKNDGLAMVTEARLKRPTINILADIGHGKTVLLVFCMRL